MNILQRRIKNKIPLYGDGLRIVIDDCRFLNEGLMLKEMGAKVWNIERPGVGRKTSHPSETEHLLIDWDVNINNELDVDSLHKSIDRYLGEEYWQRKNQQSPL